MIFAVFLTSPPKYVVLLCCVSNTLCAKVIQMLEKMRKLLR